MTWAVTKVVIVISLLFLTGLFWWLPEQLIQPAMEMTGERSDPDYFIEDFVVTAMDERGQPRYELRAARLTHYPNNQQTRLERPRLRQFDQNTVTTADRGFISGDGKTLLMRGNVRVNRAQAGAGSAAAEIITNELSVLLN